MASISGTDAPKVTKPKRTPVKPKRTPVRTPVRVPVPIEAVQDPLDPDSKHFNLEAFELYEQEELGAPEIIEANPSKTKPDGLGEIFQKTELAEFSEDDLLARSSTTLGDTDDPAWDDFAWEMMQASCAFLAQEMLSGPPEAPYNGRFMVSEHHEEWDELIRTHDRLCVLAPRDHGKTFFFDYAVPIHKAITQPGGIGFIFSATQEQAARILGDIKEEIASNPKLQWLVPKGKGNRWTQTSIHLSNGHKIYARGFGTKVRGAHPTWIVVDDGLNDETAYSEMVRKKQIDYFYTAITNMVVPGGQIIVVGTPFHSLDLYADLAKNPEYEFRRYQALDEKSGKVLWPDRYSKKRLEKRKTEIGTVRFTREFQCNPISDDMSLFPGHLFKGDPTEQFNIKLGMPLEFWESLGVSRFMGVDFAMSSSVQADYTVIWTMGVDKSGNRWLIDIQRERGMPYQHQLALIQKQAKLYEPGLIFLEANQMQRIFGDELIRSTDLPIKQFVTGVQKNSLDKGVPSLRVLLENGKFRIPRGDRHSIEMTDEWISEMQSFTWNDGKLQGVGAHDDLVMACWICDQAIRQGAFDFSFGDDVDTSGDFNDFLTEITADPKANGNGNKNGDGKEPELPQASGNLVGDFKEGAPLPGEFTRGLF